MCCYEETTVASANNDPRARLCLPEGRATLVHTYMDTHVHPIPPFLIADWFSLPGWDAIFEYEGQT